MKIKPKEVLLSLPIVLMFSDAYKVPEFAANINQLVFGKVKVKYEELGSLGDQFVGLFYLQRNDEFTELRQQFMTLIEQEQIRGHQVPSYLDEKQCCHACSHALHVAHFCTHNGGGCYCDHSQYIAGPSCDCGFPVSGPFVNTIECQHNWVMDGHNAGEPICSKCLKRE